MSRIRYFVLGLAMVCATLKVFGQQPTEPAECKNPSGGVLKGGDFSVSPQYACADYTNLTSLVTVSKPKNPSGLDFDPNSVRYNFNYRDIDGAPQFPNTLIDKNSYTTPAIYWIMMTGRSGGKSYITCKPVEIILTETPSITSTSCDVKNVTIKILDTPINKKHGQYRIDWGDNNVQFYPISTIPASGLDFSHTYATAPTVQPKIQGVYVRGSLNVCFSSPVLFNVGNSNPPFISELEGLEGGAKDKITMKSGSDGVEYSIQQRPKGGNWTDTGKKIKRNSGSITATETLDGLNGNNEYCFRLQALDGCSTPTTSNEVCTIIPKSTILSPTSAKIDWNTPAPNVIRYIIGYKESPSGANPNTASPVTPTGTTYTFDALDCKKKYNFTVTASLGTTAADRVLIKSPEILVEPNTGGKLPAKNIGTVSIISAGTIQVNILEASGFAAPNYVFYRSEGNSTNFVKVKETGDNFYNDKNVEPDKQQYCYKVEYQDQCGNTSEPSPAFCSVFLTSAQANTLNWTQFVIPDPGNELQNAQPVEYYVELLDANGSVVKPVDTTPENSSNVRDVIDQVLSDPNAKGQVTFRILAIQRATVIINGTPFPFPFNVYSNTYTFITPAQIYVPIAFTPNEDGMNDIFQAKGRFIVEFNMVIYDRWGAPIFETTNLETGWDGTASDKVTPSPPGNYGFKIYGLDPAGQKFEKIGSITLIR